MLNSTQEVYFHKFGNGTKVHAIIQVPYSPNPDALYSAQFKWSGPKLPRARVAEYLDFKNKLFTMLSNKKFMTFLDITKLALDGFAIPMLYKPGQPPQELNQEQLKTYTS